MGHWITQGSSALTKCLQEEVRDSPHKTEGFQEADSRTWHRPSTPQVFAQECAVRSMLLHLLVSLLTSFHNRKHANVDDPSASNAAKVSVDDIEKAKMEWASLQYSDDEGIDE
jgi:hypothetical protein